MHAVHTVQVGVAWRSKHGGVARRLAHAGVRRAIIRATVGLHLHNPPRADLIPGAVRRSDQDGPKERAGGGNNIVAEQMARERQPHARRAHDHRL